jgi:ribonuclease P protein component
MLAVGQRLRRRTEFTAAVRAGRRAGRGTVVVHHLSLADVRAETADEQGARAGFVIPRAVGSAVARNKVRRRLRHLLRDRLPHLQPGTDVVIRVLPGAAECSFQQLGADLDAALAAATKTSRSPGRASRSRGVTR